MHVNYRLITQRLEIIFLLRSCTVQHKEETMGKYEMALPVTKQISNEEWVLIEKYRQLPRRWQLLMQALMMPKASEKERGNDGG